MALNRRNRFLRHPGVLKEYRLSSTGLHPPKKQAKFIGGINSYSDHRPSRNPIACQTSGLTVSWTSQQIWLVFKKMIPQRPIQIAKHHIHLPNSMKKGSKPQREATDSNPSLPHTNSSWEIEMPAPAAWWIRKFTHESRNVWKPDWSIADLFPPEIRARSGA